MEKEDDCKIPYFSNRAEDLATVVQANEAVKSNNNSEVTTADRNSRRGRGRLGRGRGGNTRANSGRYTRGSDDDHREKRRQPGTGGWTSKCLNKEKCDGIHRIEHCPATNEEDKIYIAARAHSQA